MALLTRIGILLAAIGVCLAEQHGGLLLVKSLNKKPSPPVFPTVYMVGACMSNTPCCRVAVTCAINCMAGGMLFCLPWASHLHAAEGNCMSKLLHCGKQQNTLSIQDYNDASIRLGQLLVAWLKGTMQNVLLLTA